MSRFTSASILIGCLVFAPLSFAKEADQAASDTQIFENGNTFVRLEEDVLGHEVIMLLPHSLNADKMMEILIKIRTAKTNGARRVVVSSERAVSQTVVMDSVGRSLKVPVELLLQTAGAEAIREAGASERPLTRTVLTPKREVSFDRMFIASNDHPSLRDQLSAHMKIPVLDVNSPIRANVKSSLVYLVASASAPVNENFLKDLSIQAELAALGATVVFVSPYLPYARSDKVDQPGITTTGRLAADMIESCGASYAVFVRAHAPQSQGFFSIPSIQIHARESILAFLNQQGVEVVVAPDGGAFKENSIYAKELDVPVAQINKVRNPITREIEMSDVTGADIRGKVVAVVDDETSSGGTLEKSAGLLKKLGATKVVTVVVHLAGNASKALGSPNIDVLAVTDTIPVPASIAELPRLTVLPIAKEMTAQLLRLTQLAKCEVLLLK